MTPPSGRVIEITMSRAASGWTAAVTVRETASATSHRVRVRDDVVASLGRATAEDVVRWSFEFLLEREPKESILRDFDLSVIAAYFPEYERALRARFGKK
jgi:hypothetical protein